MSKTKKPNLFIVGASKCGTTSMHHYLGAHPEIFMSENKEPLYFCKDFHRESEKNNSKDYFPGIFTQEEYEKLFTNADKFKIAGESSAAYLQSTVAAKNIKDYNPEAKIIIMLRDPVEQMHSFYYQAIKTGTEVVGTFQEALELEKERRQGNKIPQNRFPSSYLYRDRASFCEQIERFQEHFSQDQIKFSLLDDLKDDAQQVYKNTLEFLGVENTEFKPDLTPQNKSKIPQFFWLSNLLKNPGVKTKKMIKKLTPSKFRLKAMSLINKIVMKKADRPDIPDQLRKDLMCYHLENVRCVSEQINRDVVKIWGYDEIDCS
jgi:hypothetical protein